MSLVASLTDTHRYRLDSTPNMKATARCVSLLLCILSKSQRNRNITFIYLIMTAENVLYHSIYVKYASRKSSKLLSCSLILFWQRQYLFYLRKCVRALVWPHSRSCRTGYRVLSSQTRWPLPWWLSRCILILILIGWIRNILSIAYTSTPSSAYVPMNLAVYLSVRLSVCVSLYLSVCLSVCACMCISLYLTAKSPLYPLPDLPPRAIIPSALT